MSTHREAEEALPAIAVAHADGGAVLVVDDQESNRALLRKFLAVDGYVVHEARSGEDGLRLMAECEPDLVLLDLMMPGMTGYDVMRRKAEDPAIAAIPVLMLTAVTQPSVKLEGLELGLNEYLTKPFNPRELKARVRNLVRMHREEVEMTRLNAELARAADSDSLTGLANRRAFDAFWESEVSRSVRYNVPVGLVIFDIDHFKQINDGYGHPVGDAILVTIGRLMLDNIRQSDFLARVGGEEFGLAIPMADEMGAAKVAEKLRAIVCSRRIPPLAALCTVSAGVASSSTMPAVDLLAAADRALYQAKCSGRNRVALASSFDA